MVWSNLQLAQVQTLSAQPEHSSCYSTPLCVPKMAAVNVCGSRAQVSLPAREPVAELIDHSCQGSGDPVGNWSGPWVSTCKTSYLLAVLLLWPTPISPFWVYRGTRKNDWWDLTQSWSWGSLCPVPACEATAEKVLPSHHM